MIIVIDAVNRHEFGAMLDDMQRLRARVFRDRLERDVTIRDGRETDAFDPAYVICLDDAGDVVGGLRLSRTTAPVWEATRICVDTERLADGAARHSAPRVMAELMIGALDHARAAGARTVAAVGDPAMGQLMHRAGGIRHDDLGATGPEGATALLDCTEARIRAIRDLSGLQHDVMLTRDGAAALYRRNRAQPDTRARNRPPMTRARPAGNAAASPALRQSLHHYACALLRTATTRREVEATLALIDLLSEQFGTSGTAELSWTQEIFACHSRRQALTVD